MADTWTDSAGILRDQIGVVVAGGPVYGVREAIGWVEGDTAIKVVLTDDYVANDGTLRDTKPIFYPGTDTYLDSAGILRDTRLIGTVVAPSEFATGSLSFNGNVLDGETVAIGATVEYRYVTVLAQAYDVLIGATASLTILNHIAAVNDSGIEGVNYGNGTQAHPDVTAASAPGQMDVTANIAGVGGNSIVTTSTSLTATWGAATLEGGA